jgi:putative hydrolases of HD superfamily
MKDLEKIFYFFHETRKLKEVRRYGAHKKIKGDSSADHSWRVALMAFILADGLNIKLDKLKAIKLALIHDLSEAICGDVDVVDVVNGAITKEEKNKRELLAIKKICSILPEKLKDETVGLWEEYEARKSREAKFVRAVDKLETITHLLEDGYKSYDVPEIIANYPDDAVKNFPKLNDTLIVLKKRLKKEFAKGKIPWKKEYDSKDK